MYVYKYGRDEMLMFVLNLLRHVVATATLIIFLKQSAAKTNKWVTIVYNIRDSFVDQMEMLKDIFTTAVFKMNLLTLRNGRDFRKF